MNFKDPISTFAYNLISLHHDIMWYIIIILSLVYWSLYKVMKEYSWNNYNKTEGFILILTNKKFLFKIQMYIFYIWLNIFKIIYNIFEFILKLIYINLELRLINKKSKSNTFFIKLFSFILGSSFIKGINENNLKKNFSLKYFKSIIIERYLASYLFNESSNALYFYDGYDNYLLALKFKHSINLEYIFGMFPTVIIGLIIVPSMYLLYSNETDIIFFINCIWYMTETESESSVLQVLSQYLQECVFEWHISFFKNLQFNIKHTLSVGVLLKKLKMTTSILHYS